MKPIFNFTMKELIDNRDANFIHHDKHTKDLQGRVTPELKYCYANTIVLDVKSYHYGETVNIKKGQKGTNQTIYKVFILLEDFYTIGKDKDIDLEDAIDYALNYGDVHIRCNCPAFLYWGYAYIGTQLRYLYGIPHENRYPHIRNPEVRGTICKHADAVLQYCISHKSTITQMFETYYNRLKDGQSIYAVNANGTTITIGHKNDTGDIFFERQEEEKELEELADKTNGVDQMNPDTWGEWEDDSIDQMNPDTWWDEESEDNIIEDE